MVSYEQIQQTQRNFVVFMTTQMQSPYFLLFGSGLVCTWNTWKWYLLVADCVCLVDLQWIFGVFLLKAAAAQRPRHTRDHADILPHSAVQYY